MMSGLGGTLMQGMAFGAGSEVAHRAVGGLMGGSGGHAGYQEQPQEQGGYAAPPQQEVCQMENMNFMNCLQSNANDIGSCQSYLDLFKQCRADNQQFQ
jgi:hypothetical protein